VRFELDGGGNAWGSYIPENQTVKYPICFYAAGTESGKMASQFQKIALFIRHVQDLDHDNFRRSFGFGMCDPAQGDPE